MAIALGRNGQSLLSLSRAVPAETGQQVCVLDRRRLSARTLPGTGDTMVCLAARSPFCLSNKSRL